VLPIPDAGEPDAGESDAGGGGARVSANDFDGDGKSDLAVFCPASQALFYVLFSGGGSNISAPAQLGIVDSLPVAGDYDGDGTADFAAYTALASGELSTWEILAGSGSAEPTQVLWGLVSMIPAPGDFDGDTRTDHAMFEPATGRWYIIFSSTGETTVDDPPAYGYLGSHPAVADYDGDGMADMALYDRKTFAWHVLKSSDGQSLHSGTVLGALGDRPAVADYDGDGRADLAVYRPSDGSWHVRRSSDDTELSLSFGGRWDMPVPGDYDGDGKADLALYRRARDGANGKFFVRTVEGTTIHDGVEWGYGQCRGLLPVEADPAGFVLVPSGTFQMGLSPGDSPGGGGADYWGFDIEKPHEVTITRDYWIKATEVTQGEWVAVTGSNPTVFTGCGDRCPVDNLSWFQAAAYCNALSLREGLTPCYFSDSEGTVPYDFAAAAQKTWGLPYWPLGLDCEGYRLPTEAEWEYAARAATTTGLYGALEDIAWYDGNSHCSYAGCVSDNYCGESSGIASGPHPGASKAPNAWGLYDTAGNLWELVWDEFGEYPDLPTSDPTGALDCGSSVSLHCPAHFRVARGGSWLNGLNEAIVSRRDGNDCTCDDDFGQGHHTGFRVARTVK
jgi:formylglycine-generating enzyme required for sulfatase activity